MALTVTIKELNTATPTYTTVTDIKYGTADMVNPLQNGQADYYPIPIPGADLTNSYWKSHCLDLAGTFDDVRNGRVYFTDPAWTLGTNGVKIIGNRDSGDIGCADASYEQAGGSQGVDGYYIDDNTNGHTFYKSQTTPFKEWSQWTSGSPGTFDSSFYTSAGKTKHVVTQVRVGPSASAARQTGGTMTFKWTQVE